MLLLALLAAATLSQEFIYETAPFPECHASTVIETAPGELLVSWFGGTKEGANDVAIWGSRRVNGKWSEPFEIVREPNIPTFNPVLFKTRDGVLWLYYRFGPKPDNWSSARMTSRDNGRTWSKPEYLPSGLLGPIKNKPLVLDDGTVISGTSYESYQAWTSWIERSNDNGKTLHRAQALIYPADRRGTIQPAIVKLNKSSQNLRAFVRSTDRIGYILYADSKDGGRTWTELKSTGLENPNSGIDAVSLRDGRILMVYNPTRKGRTPLVAAVSSDGDKWTNLATLESEPGEYSYPAVVQGADGVVHITYTWKRKRVRYARLDVESAPASSR
jgi:predicted neuraminidase